MKKQLAFVAILATCLAATVSGGPTRPVTAKAGPIRGGQPAQSIALDLRGQKCLVLRTAGYSWGQSTWGEAEIVYPDGRRLRLSSRKPLQAKVGWGQLSFDKAYDNKPLRIADRTLKHGIFSHADSLLVYELDGNAQRFESLVGVNHTAATRGCVTFTAEAFPVPFSYYAQQNEARKALAPESLAAFRQALESMKRHNPRKATFYTECQARVSATEARVADLLAGMSSQDSAAIRDVRDFLAFKRQAMMSLVDRPLLFVKRNPYYAGHIYDSYLTYRPGGGIYVLENPADPPTKHRVRPIINPATPETLGDGVYRDPDLSWDGKRLLFAFKGKEGNTSIYEIGIDGKGLRRITNADAASACGKPSQGLVGKGHHDVHPCYMADGRIAFTSTRTGGHVMCFSSYIDILHTVNADGSDLKCVSVNNQNEFDPAMLPDGRILYGRWEYVDKTALYMQSLWTVNPDGTHETALFANNMAKPTALLGARPVPGNDLIVCSLTPHNGQPVGAIAMIDPKVGKNTLDAIFNFTPEYPTAMDQGLRQGPCDPWPLNEDFVLTANNNPKLGPHGIIQLIDRFGNRVEVLRDASISCYSPIPLAPRERPAVRPSRLEPGKPALFLVHDMYKGMPDVPRGSIKQLRVIETTSRVSGIPRGGRWWNQAFLVSWQGSYDIKNVLGVVPVAEDGSAYFEAPPGKAIYFQALDADGKLVHSQRTFVQAAAGITRSCAGCHVHDEDVAPVLYGRKPTAHSQPPARLAAETWGTGFIDYPTMVQPILDKHCVTCHGGADGIAAGVDLTGGWTWAFNISYETLIKNTLTGFLNCNNGSVRTAEILPPRTHGSGAAPLADLLVTGHKKRIPNMTAKERDLLLAWMDGNCNYYGTWDYTPHAVCNAGFTARPALLAEMEKADCLKCHQKEIGNDWINLRTPERSRILRAPLAKKGLGLAWCRNRKAPAVDRPLVRQGQQPPDVFRPKRKAAPNTDREAVVSFGDDSAPGYRAMLAIIQKARNDALKTPRVDMPGAEITPGKCRELEPLTPPKLAER